MQTIKVECQECEDCKTYETEGLLLIMKLPNGQGDTVYHNLDPSEALLNAVKNLDEGVFGRFCVGFLGVMRERQ